MASNGCTMLMFLCCCFFARLYVLQVAEGANNVTYDSRSLIIDGERKLLISASIHYPRSVPAMWPGLVKTAKEGGIDVIETYVFWNGHEPSPGNYYFGGRYDLPKFVKIVQDAGMLLILRIGPFVAAEWNYGGVPVWLHYVKGTVFRTDNEPFKYYMQRFVSYNFLFQVENEYGFYEAAYGEGGKAYTQWAAKMALSQNIGVPWIMCQQWDAPYPVINTCNSFYCDDFKPAYPTMPKIWTENWPGWFKAFGGRSPHRPPEDIAYAVARFFQKGGSVQNYYMYHGGTNFGRTSGGPFITTSYDYDAPIDEYGLPRFPKWGHLKELHRAIKLCEHALLNNEPTLVNLGPQLEADVYEDESGTCAAFIANLDDKNDKTVEFRGGSYTLPAWSVSILPDCKTVVFNTAKVGSQTSTVEMVSERLQSSMTSPNKDMKAVSWEIYVEKAGIWGKPDFTRNGFVDHINTTKDTTDYLWQTTRLFVDENEEFLTEGNNPMLLIESKGHALHAFVNGILQASAIGSGNFTSPVSLKPGENEIAILSMTVGLSSAGPFYEWNGAGLTSVKLQGLKNTLDLSNATWNYKAVVDAPPGDEPVALDMLHMGKGLAWLNGEQIGRYWPLTAPTDNCVETCDYRGKFSYDKCDKGCGEPTQRWYHVPRSWFKPEGNVLVLFEEKGGDPSQIMFSRRKVFCAHCIDH
ncbi:beta-galactosidase 10 [Artemisia annua]|uniref:beta-galactosidase n=1 Tax=Artemisia annua TaxID=35608 RepID=A0A2U1MIN3_ARTAN|nr:beta-galactosidase 10 [Artemisia annua]